MASITPDPNDEATRKTGLHQGSDIAALLIAATIGYLVNLVLPILLAACISCSLLIMLSRLRRRLHRPSQWWGSIGLCSGCFIGTASSMVIDMQQGGAVTACGNAWPWCCCWESLGSCQVAESGSIPRQSRDARSETCSAL